MLEQTLACCMYAPGSYDGAAKRLKLDGVMSDVRDGILATRLTAPPTGLDQYAICQWIDDNVAAGMTRDHTRAMGVLCEAWWDMPESMRARALELSETNRGTN